MPLLEGYAGEYYIWGPPGTGKTTFLSRQIRAIIEKNGGSGIVEPSKTSVALICSLTRTAAAEIGGRNLGLPKRSIGTLHRHALHAIKGPVKVMDGEAIAEWNSTKAGRAFPLSTESGVSVDADGEATYEMQDGAGRAADGDRCLQAYDLARHRMVPAVNPRIKSFSEMYESFKKDNGLIDFTDMIHKALVETEVAPGAPLVIIADEAQDLSRLEFNLLMKWSAHAQATFFAGDRDQSLYTWRGAHPDLFVDCRDESRRKVLSQSYRVSRAVHRAARSIISRSFDYVAADYSPRDSEGSLRHAPQVTYRNPDALVRLVEADLSEGRSVMIQATCSYMLPKTIDALRSAGLPYSNPWRRKNGAWNPLFVGEGKRSTAGRIADFLAVVGAGLSPEEVAQRRGFGWTAGELQSWMKIVGSKGCVRRGQKKVVEGWEDEALERFIALEDCHEFIEPEPLDALIGGVAESLDSDGSTALLEWLRGRLTGTHKKPAEFPIKILESRGVSAMREEPTVYVGTVHSFKGGEADSVYLYPDISRTPHKAWARAARTGPEDTYLRRVFYVGVTRARESVTILGASGPINVPLYDWCNGRL